MALTLLSFLLFVWRERIAGFSCLAVFLLFLSAFFLFYTLNYRTLIIRLTPEMLELEFGIFTWSIPLADIESCSLDDISLWRIGGAGIHFTFIRKRYRAFFNFLEYPRVVLALKTKKGPVRDIAFSTQRPGDVIQYIEQASSGKQSG